MNYVSKANGTNIWVVEDEIVEMVGLEDGEFFRLAWTLRRFLSARRMALRHQRLLFRLGRNRGLFGSFLLSLLLGNEKEDEERVADEDASPQLAELAKRQQRTRRFPIGRQKRRLVEGEKHSVSRMEWTEKGDARWMPSVWPTELQALCQPLFFLESIVNAHPSTAMSCVAASR